MSDLVFEYKAKVAYERVKQYRETIERLEAELDDLRRTHVKSPQLSKGPSEMLGKAWAERNGYIKLNVDVADLRQAVEDWGERERVMPIRRVQDLVDLARQVLVALDREDT